jgi:hypothetical protein
LIAKLSGKNACKKKEKETTCCNNTPSITSPNPYRLLSTKVNARQRSKVFGTSTRLFCKEVRIEKKISACRAAIIESLDRRSSLDIN